MPLLQVSSGIVDRGVKGIIYGPESSGKSTLSSKFPNPIFLDFDDGTATMEHVNRYPTPTTWNDSLAFLADLYAVNGQLQLANGQMMQTLVIDGISKVEELCVNFVCANGDVGDITEFGYGKGYEKVFSEFCKFIDWLDAIKRSFNINVILIGHSTVKKFESPDTESYDRYQLDMIEAGKTSTPNMLKKWADVMLFCNFKATATKMEGEKKAKGAGGARTIYTSHTPSHDAKNRYKLTSEIMLEDDAAVDQMIKTIFNIQEQPVQTQPMAFSQQ
jgi:hypothetical protein